jgi:bifunctional non-homologous end joining protein LigD
MSSPRPRALQRYRDKRHFDRTPEPSGAVRRSTKRLEFVIQRHHARRLHYDFRLEWDGVLKSWAVPKGPSLDPAEKRLAVQVEDHPFEYRKFRGEIPAGQYGAGTVIIWDRGRWIPQGDVDQGLERGKLDFTLEGQRLHGGWSLVRLRGDANGKSNWLLIKRRDEHAQRQANNPDVTELYTDDVDSGATARKPAARKAATAAPPARAPARSASRPGGRVDFIPPQLATLADRAPGTGHWLTELKFDGYRILAYVDGERARCFTRNGLDWTHRMPAVAAALCDTGLRKAWLDGELVAVDERGVPQFQRLQQALDPASREQPILMVFDALKLLGTDLRDKPQQERKRMLQQALAALPRGGIVRLTDYVDGESTALLERACGEGFEGVIVKDADAPYRPGRNRHWLKLKCRREQEFVVGGYTRTESGRETLTSLLLGYHDERGRLQFAGRAGTGFSETQLAGLRRQLDALAQDASPFANPPKLRGRERPRWVQPSLVAQVRFAEWTESGILRQPLFLGLREDVEAARVRREPDRIAVEFKAMTEKATPNRASRSRRRASRSAPGRAARAPAATSTTRVRAASPKQTSDRAESLKLTHPERVLYPADGVTKLELAEYYAAVAHVLWPHLKSRPLSLLRATSDQGKVFFQRHVDGDSVPGLTSVKVPGSDEEPYFVCSSEESVPLLAQMGAVELHTWGSHMPRPDVADRVTFDLDPDPALPWPQVRGAATLVRELLRDMGLQVLLKTSGGMGLHIVAPLTRGPSMEVAAAFARRVAEHLARLIPQLFSAKRGAANRQGRIYIDWQRNQFAATTVSAYSPRHRTGVPVSLPIHWEELGRKDIRAQYFNLRNVAARVADSGDAWADALPVRQSLTRTMIERLDTATGHA